MAFPQPLCGGWGKMLAGVHYAYEFGPRTASGAGNTDGEVFMNFWNCKFLWNK